MVGRARAKASLGHEPEPTTWAKGQGHLTPFRGRALEPNGRPLRDAVIFRNERGDQVPVVR